MACSRSSVGTRTSPRTNLRRSTRSGGNNPDGVGWAVDLSWRINPRHARKCVMAYGNGKARAVAWNLPDPLTVHREPSTRRGPISSRNIRRVRTGVSSAWPIRLLRSEGGGGQGLASNSRSLTSGRLVNTKAAAKKPGRTNGSPIAQDRFVEVNNV